MHKEVISSDKARVKLLEGVNELANTVGGTLGPRGRNVIIQQEDGAPLITKDGVTVAKSITFADPGKNLGSEAIKETAQQTADVAGDGTSTATILAQAIFNKGHQMINEGSNPIELKRGMDIAVAEVVKQLKSISNPVDSDEFLEAIATISSNGDTEIGSMIAKAIDEVGRDGIITVQESNSNESELEIVEGMEIERGYLSHHFMNDQDTLTCKLSKVKVLLYDGVLSDMEDIIPILEQTHGKGDALVVIAESVEGPALATMVVNSARAGLKILALKAPGFGNERSEILRDIAALTGAMIITSEIGLTMDDLTYDHLGDCDTVIADKTKTALIGGGGTETEINDRVDFIKTQKDKSESDYEKVKLQSRLSKILGGVAIIKVGAQSEIEMKEKKDRVNDAVLAVKAAIEEGVVPGGGAALLHSIRNLNSGELKGDKLKGYEIVIEACKAPFTKILTNAGVENIDWYMIKLEELNGDSDTPNTMGYDVVSGEHVDMLTIGIIDPTKVTRTALEKAVSVAGTLLTTEAMVIFDKEDKEKEVKPNYNNQ